jgi:integrase
MGAGTRNEYRQELVGFGNWCVRTRRLLSNPFTGVPKADAKADCRRKRRSLTEDEIRRLLDVAGRRPLLEAMTVRRGRQKGEAVANLNEATRRRLELLGEERALIYKTLVLTGLRKAELTSLTVAQLVLDGPAPYLSLNAADEKNRQGNSIPLRSDLAADLREWLDTKAEALQKAACCAPTVWFDPAAVQTRNRNMVDTGARQGQTCQGLPPETKLFTVPAGLRRILDRDLKATGIPKRDEGPDG